MSRFCPNCGNKLTDTEVFCSECGTKVSLAEDNSSQVQKRNRVNKKKCYWVIGGVVIILIVIAGGVFFYWHHKQVVEETVQPTKPAVTATNTTSDKTQKVKQLDPVEEAQAYVAEHGMKFKVLATSYNKNNLTSLSIIELNGVRGLFILDTKNNESAVVGINQDLRNFYNRNTSGDGTIQFTMEIYNAPKDNDSKAGVWDGDNHIIPILARYKINADGNVTPGLLTTDQGRNPAEYEQYLYETSNVDLANTVLTQMKALRDNATMHNVDF